MKTLQGHIFVQEELERRILHGIACEWEVALWVLGSAHRARMKKPLFSLKSMKSKWGYWSEEKHEICLNRRLVLNYPWDSVREVLLHEMAHQFAETVFDARNEPPHGTKFKEACHLLRANPKASGRYRPLLELIFHDSDTKDKILLRIKKLMALAESRNHHEAESAMAKAHEFIAKYNVDLLAHETERDFVSVFVGTPALRHPREAYHLARLLEDFYFVQGLWVSAYVIEKSKMGRVLEISGTIQNIKIADYIFDFVRNFIQTEWDKYNAGKGFNRYRKTGFAVGIIEGFRSKLTSQIKTNKKVREDFPLIRIEDPMLTKYVAYRYPRTKSFTRNASSQDDGILNDGMGVGRKLIISKGITSKKRSKLLLPER